MAIPDAPDEDFEDEFIDDFLNDLDAPEDPEDEELDPFDDDDAPGRADTRARLSSDAEGGYAAYEIDEADTDEDTVVKQQESNATAAMEETGKNSERSLPVGMFAVVLLALALLAVGGYGVIQQRGELQAEIRDLQSKLATAPSAEDTELEREQQRQMALENESLGAELEALAAENSALATQLSALEEQLAERTAQAEAAQAEAERVAAAAAAAAKKAAAPAARSSAATPAAATQGGPWFVNFGSYAQRDVADRWAGELAVESGKVVVQTATAAGKTLYRVRVVGLATQDSAERVATTLEREYRLPRLWVGKN
jgi:cell division protein FtsN